MIDVICEQYDDQLLQVARGTLLRGVGEGAQNYPGASLFFMFDLVNHIMFLFSYYVLRSFGNLHIHSSVVYNSNF